MKRIFRLMILLLASSILHQPLYAQGLLKKLKEKANEVANKAVEKKVDEAIGIENKDADANNPSGNNRKGRPTNKGGEGLKNTTPPNVAQQIAEAETSYTAKNYSDARFAVQQALMGVELQIGKAILKSMPLTVSQLPADTADDKVVSTSWGWANLTILRSYTKDDKQLEISVGNNSFYSGWINMYFTNTYVQSNTEQQNVKQIKVKDNRAVIQYEPSEGYTVLVPLGQNGMIVWNGINFANETEMMAAVNAFDVNGIKKMLGEK
jgi:hypothetical protein